MTTTLRRSSRTSRDRWPEAEHDSDDEPLVGDLEHKYDDESEWRGIRSSRWSIFFIIIFWWRRLCSLLMNLFTFLIRRFIWICSPLVTICLISFETTTPLKASILAWIPIWPWASCFLVCNNTYGVTAPARRLRHEREEVWIQGLSNNDGENTIAYQDWRRIKHALILGENAYHVTHTLTINVLLYRWITGVAQGKTLMTSLIRIKFVTRWITSRGGYLFVNLVKLLLSHGLIVILQLLNVLLVAS